MVSYLFAAAASVLLTVGAFLVAGPGPALLVAGVLCAVWAYLLAEVE